MKIYKNKLKLAMIISFLFSLLYSLVIYFGSLENQSVSSSELQSYILIFFVVSFLVDSTSIYIFLGALTVVDVKKTVSSAGIMEFEEEKGFWYYTRKFFYWRAMISIISTLFAFSLVAFFCLYIFLSEYLPVFASLAISLIIGFLTGLVLLSFLLKNYRKRKERSRRLDELQKKRQEDARKAYLESIQNQKEEKY